MTPDFILTNARIVTADAVILGTVVVRDGLIAVVAEGMSNAPGATDCGGDYVVPGLVELHTDNLEKHFTPRPGVRWPKAAAMMAHDAQMAAAGITTVYDAISIGDMIEGSDRLANLEAMIGAVSDAQASGRCRADHRLHLRCEVSSANILGLFGAFVDNPLVGIVSLMDHTPGQRQFVHEHKYREYYMGKYGFSAAEMDAFTERQIEASRRYSDPHRRAIAAESRERAFILASHDDATPEHVAEAVELGLHFAEFPTTVEAAKCAEAAGMKILMGAPNVVRGGSHSGNVSAAQLAAAGCLDVLSSDYVPVSLLHSAFLLHNSDIAMPLPEAVAKVSRIPAEVAGLDDRGVIAEGRRADIVLVHDADAAPVVRAAWCAGKRIA